jgi:threonine aldolase
VIVDLRSDTVTKPTPAMRKAMADADVGDDVYGEDPTVNRLQEMMAERLGKEASLFVVSGSMANQVAVRVHTRAGDEVIVDATGHSFLYESGGLGGISHVQANPISGRRGLMTVEQIEAAIRPRWDHYARTSLVIVENTSNGGGGTIYDRKDLRAIG